MTAPACGSCTAPVGDGARLCKGCTRDLAALLLRAADIAPDLDDAVARLLRRGGSGGSTSPEPPLPLDLTASDVKYQLSITLARWVRAVHELPSRRDDPWPRYGITHCAGWLTARLTALRQHQDAGQLPAELRVGIARALAVIDRQPERIAAGTCTGCGRQLLAELDTDQAVCSCGNVVAGQLAAREARAHAANQIETATAISRALKQMGIDVLASTIRTWHTRGQLADKGERRGETAYSMTDVIDLCNKRDERKREARVRS